MNKLKLPENENKVRNSRNAFKGGSYSLLVTAMALALLIVVNIFVSALPSSATEFDISSSKLYSVTSNTKTVLNNLSEDVKIYWIVQSGEEDPVIENLLGRYGNLSDHIEVIKKNPDVFPTFAQQYTDKEVMNNSLIVECGERSRYIGFEDIYIMEPNVTSYSYNTSFDGEGAITSAIDYVVNAELPKLYLLEGHGEPELSESFKSQLTKANLELSTISLLNEDEIPEDAAAVMIYSPATDISPEEADMLISYAESGGSLMVMAGPSKDAELTNLNSILERYGVKTEKGIVIEENRGNYVFRTPYVLMPEIVSNPITDSLISDRYFPVIPISSGLSIGEVRNGAVVNELLHSTEKSFIKAEGYQLESFEKEAGDKEGPFTIGVNIDCGTGGKIVWLASSNILDDLYNAYSSGANTDLVMNSLTELIGDREAIAIRAKSLNYNYLTISESTAGMIKFLMIGVIPLAYLGVGIAVVLRRKGKHCEQV